jgi:nucleolar protein 12
VPVATTSAKPLPKLPISNEDQDDGQTSSSGNDNSNENEDESSTSASESDVESEANMEERAQAERPRKRRRVTNSGAEDLEESYFRRLEREEEKEQRQRQAERGDHQVQSSEADKAAQADTASASDSDDDSIDDAANGTIPQHESLQATPDDADKLQRTVFLGNVSTEAIKSKAAKRTLGRHLRSVLKTPPEGKRPGKLESLRFRSTAYVSGSGPKKATFAKKELMDTTTKSTNAYAVFTTVAAADVVTEKLNGSIVLDRHLSRFAWSS